MKDKIIYLTYQTFPSDKANTIQTIDNAKYIKRKGYEITIVFPLRSEYSTDNKNILKKHYDFKEDIKFKGVKHNLPFGKYKRFEKYLFLFSHFIWTKRVVKSYLNDGNLNTIFFTRSDWIFYFLSRKDLNVTFECHQLTKLRKWIIKKSIKHERSKIIFLNKNLSRDSGLTNKYSDRFIVLHNGVDSELFNEKIINEKKIREITFTGNIQRFNEDRGLRFIIDSFSNDNMPEEFNLKIIGWPVEQINELKEYINKVNLNHRVSIIEKLDRKSTISEIQNSNIGLLVNSSTHTHSFKHTSPLKYFEFLFGELCIVAVDFPSHRSLPFSHNISFFQENDQEGFIQALIETLDKKPLKRDQLESVTLNERVNTILNFIQ